MQHVSFIDYVNQAPGLAMVKSLDSQIVACSTECAQLLGFDKPKKILGIYDQDLPCQARHGQKNFRYQDLKAMEEGEHKAIDIYRYANNELKIIYQQKKALIIDEQLIGISFSGVDLSHTHWLSEQMFNLLTNDSRFLTVDQQKAYSYNFSDCYPDSTLNAGESLCLYYLLRGKSNAEIASLMYLSSRTIESKVTAIRDKLGCKNRQQLIEFAIEQGYLRVILKQIFNQPNISIDLS